MAKHLVVSFLGAFVGISTVYLIAGLTIDIPTDWWLSVPSMLLGIFAGWLGNSADQKIKSSESSGLVKLAYTLLAYGALGCVPMFFAAALFEQASLTAFLIGFVVSLATFSQPK
jgi:hypothetical protein